MIERLYIFVLGVKVSGTVVYTNTEYSTGTSLDNAHNNRWLADPLDKNVVVLNAYVVLQDTMLMKLV